MYLVDTIGFVGQDTLQARTLHLTEIINTPNTLYLVIEDFLIKFTPKNIFKKVSIYFWTK